MAQRPPPSRARAVARPVFGPAPHRSIDRIRTRPGPGLPPVLRGFGEHYLVAGPIFGVLSAAYGFHLSQAGAAHADAATGATIRLTQVWHGQLIRAYYITPAQNALRWALTVPALLWLVLLLATLVGLGVRSHYAARRRAG